MKIKKLLMTMLAVVLALSFPACDSSEAGEPRDAFAVMESPEEETTGLAASETVVTGTVVYYDGMTLVICSRDNRTLNFLVADDEIDQDEARGLATGSEADVYYAGEIDGSNTSAARVTKLAQSIEQSAAGTDFGVTGGVITGADESALSIMSFDGKALIFSIAGEGIDMEHTNGLTAGDYVTVFYEGEIGSGNGSSVKAVKLVQ